MAVVPMSPEWWLDELSKQLAVRQPTIDKMDSYYSGDHPLPFVTKAHEAKVRNQFRTMLADSKANFARLVVDVVAERMRVDGFRLSAASDQSTDMDTWRIWQANQMDSLSQSAFVEALVKGVSYLSVWDGDDGPSLAVEDPSQTIVGYEPGSNFRRRAAALKLWTDEWTGRERANVYLPAGIWKFERASVSDTAMFSPERPWEMLDDGFVANPVGVVPIVPLPNRQRLLLEGESELTDVVPLQNQINGFLFLLALAGYFGAHRQRWATGIKLSNETDDNSGDAFDVAIDRMLVADSTDAKFGDFEASPLDGYLKAIEQKVQHIAVTTRTPKHYLMPEGQEPSGDSIKSAESGLVKKVEWKRSTFGEGLEEALRLARLFAGESDAPVDSEIVWADAQVRTEAEITDAAIKRFSVGLTPWQQTMEDLGYSATQIERMRGQFPDGPPVADQSDDTAEVPVTA